MDSKAYKKNKRIENRERMKEEMEHYNQKLNELLADDAREQLAFSPTLTSGQRKKLHAYAHKIGLKSKSKGSGDDRFLIVFKKTAVPFVPTGDGATAFFRLADDSIEKMTELMEKHPVSDEEKRNANLLRPINNQNNVHLPFMFGNSNSKTRLTVPPFQNGNSEFIPVRQSLPIYEYGSEILKAINSNQVVVISGETVFEKTTQVPQYIMEECSIDQEECRIICTQPRRLAATSIATRISQERNDSLGRSVGYQIRLDSRVTSSTNLILTTSGFLLRCLTGSKPEDVYKNLTHLILDEVHEREKVTDFLLIAIRDAIRVNPHLKVILMSATLDSEQFSKYFNDCPIINVPGRLFDVEIMHLGEVLTKTGYMSKKMQMYMMENQGPKALRSTENKPIAETEEIVDENQVESKTATISEDDIQFYDACFDECFSQDDDSAFEQIFCLINDENMPIDYMHSQKGRTALSIASEKGFFEVLTRLITLGADPSFVDKHGKTAMDYAEENEQEDCCEILTHYVHLKPVKVTAPKSDESSSDVTTKALQQFTLVAYQMTFLMKPTEIDHELLNHVIVHIHTENSSDGSILVFLPGYEDIMTQKELIETSKMIKFQLFMLHSGVNGINSSEQSRVFDPMPSGIRKIILSTNIAETSLTINDVVYVIDAGKVKQQSYDSISESTCLTSTDISQACAKQRAGRAGRIRNGYCYRLYSLEQYEAMEKYTLPEILRVPLTEICLNAKMLAGDLSIEEFLLKALQPPSVKNIRQSIELLKRINALDAEENITFFGIHLPGMPVDCQLGKMILYSIILQCIDPVVTIVSVLSVKDPFMLPLGNEGEQINKIKKDFAQGSLSDHQMLLNAFEEWSKDKNRSRFCAENFISNGNMQMIQGIRRLIMGHLKMAGFIDEKSARNIKKLNKNSLKWEIVKACLTAGLYPNVCRISNLGGKIFSKQDKKLAPHLSSVIRERRARGQVDPNVSNAGAEWLVHGEKSRISNLCLIRNITVVPAVDVILFAGPLNLSEENLSSVSERKIEGQSDMECDDIPADEDFIFNDDEDDDDNLFANHNDNESETIFHIDDWINFIVDKEEADLLVKIRTKFASMLLRFLQKHQTFQPSHCEMRMLDVLIYIIEREDEIEKRIKTQIENKVNETGDHENCVENENLMWRNEMEQRNNRKPIPEQSHRSAITSGAYTQALQPEHQRNKKKNNKNSRNNKKQESQNRRFNNTNYAENMSASSFATNEPLVDLCQPSTSNVNPQQKFEHGLFNNIPSYSAPTPKDIGFSSSRPGVTLSDIIPNRYFILTVKDVPKLYESIYDNDWKFSTPLKEMRKIERECKPAKIILLLHAQNKSAIFSSGQFQSKGKSYFIKVFPHCHRPFKPLYSMNEEHDRELSPDEGYNLHNICMDVAKASSHREPNWRN